MSTDCVVSKIGLYKYGKIDKINKLKLLGPSATIFECWEFRSWTYIVRLDSGYDCYKPSIDL